MSYTSKYKGEEIDALLDKVQASGGNLICTKLNTARLIVSKYNVDISDKFQLTDSILNYDLILVEANLQTVADGYTNRTVSVMIIPENLKIPSNNFRYRLEIGAYSSESTKFNCEIYFGFAAENILEIGHSYKPSDLSGRNFSIANVTGLKIVPGSASANFTNKPKAFLQKKLDGVGTNTAFDMDVIKNDGFDISNNRILLKANKTYTVRYLVEVFTDATEFGFSTTLANKDGSEQWAILYAPSLSVSIGNFGERTIIVTPEQDTELTFITAPYGGTIGYAWTKCIIEEF